MGHKVHPIGFRIGIIRDWQAKWYADKHYVEFLQEDLKLRKGIQERYAEAAVSQVEIERQANKVSITIYTARPGIVIGRGGQRVDETRAYLEHLIGKKVQLNIQEIQRPELDAYLVAKQVAEQIERRIAFRRAMKQTLLRTMQAGAKGMKVSCAGRLGGAEIARRLTMHEGRVPLHTLRADIDYGFIEAKTTMGRIGIKVWIYKGDILPEAKEDELEEGILEAVAVVETEAESVAEEPAAEVKSVDEEKIEETELAAAEESAEKEIAEEEKPAKPAARRRKKAATEETEDTTDEESAEEEKPARPATKRKTRAKAEPKEEKTEEPVAEAESAEEEENSATT
ncbi:MAG: 30S ribosomal protein S3 [Chloroflexi bacterium RBG_13_46_14]|nr:MAG: 30S ribosomal protein S3 [Chloroflexi bacterium RBG_13_46_14]